MHEMMTIVELPMFAVSVCQAAEIGGGIYSVRCVPCHSVQPLSNAFGRLLQNLYSAQIQACPSQRRWCRKSRLAGKGKEVGSFRLCLMQDITSSTDLM